MQNTTAPAVSRAEAVKKYKKTSQFGETMKRMARNKAAVLGLIILVALILMSLCADFLYDYDTYVVKQNIADRLQWPSAQHPLGTDEFGRDLLARIVHGSRTSLLLSFAAVALSLAVGGFLGAIAGYYGKWLDNLLMRIMDVILAIPMTLFAMVIVAALGASTLNLVIALSVSQIPTFARVVRGAVLTVKDSEYIEAARAIGQRDLSIISAHVLPNCMAPIIVQTTLRIAATITSTASLSFLGLGVTAPTPEWGALLSTGRTFIRDSSYLTFFPGLFIMITILSLNLLGDGLRDALDPRLR